MPAKTLILPQAIVLKLAPSGENYTQVQLLTPEHGTLSTLKRNQSKASPSSIDLFDQGEAQLDHKPSDGSHQGFLNGFSVSKKRIQLGQSYPALKAASWISNLFLQNPLHQEEDAETFQLAEKALDALARNSSPQAVLLKTLYLLARHEGYPVKEDWARKLEPILARNVATLINTPLHKIRLDLQSQQAAFSALARYIEHHTYLKVPSSAI